MIDPYRSCSLCPRNCGVDRNAGERGFCGETAELRLAVASIHRGEEPPVVAAGGSGTIFVSGCALRCTFCQNHQISQESMGAPVDRDLFVRICLTLQDAGAENINIVTGGHAAPAILEGLGAARAAGLEIPALWNSSAYESVAAIDLVAPQVPVWLPDLKTLDASIADRYFRAADYPEAAKAAIERMASLSPLRFGPSRQDPAVEAIRSGVIVRHLVLPGRLESTRQVLRWFAERLAGKALLSLMTQYTPVRTARARAADAIPEGYLDEGDYEATLSMLEEFGIEDGFYQELVTGSDWLPDFRKQNPFSSELSVPIWHWRHGFAV